jgi:hypothetical protein
MVEALPCGAVLFAVLAASGAGAQLRQGFQIDAGKRERPSGSNGHALPPKKHDRRFC